MSSEAIKVLLVEDNLGDARLLFEGMDEALPGQFQMTHVRRLNETLEALWENSYSVVLLDLGLPDSHGLETLILVRAQAPHVPIVVLTGFNDEELGDMALKEGAQDYLVKGQVDSKTLARSMRYAIARRAAEEALVQQGVALARAEDLQRSRQRLIAVHERVRRAVAAELHDGVQTKLDAAADRLRELVSATNLRPETTRVLNEAIAGIRQVSELQVGALGRRLYPAALGEGLAATFQALGEHCEAAPGIEVVLDPELLKQEEENPSLIPEPVGLAMYRIAEEALANVARHARAGKATLWLDPLQKGWWRLTVKDDGQGFALGAVRQGLGLATMQDYARALDGECVIQSAPGKGTEITAALPLSPADAKIAGNGGK